MANEAIAEELEEGEAGWNEGGVEAREQPYVGVFVRRSEHLDGELTGSRGRNTLR